jgi:hypothetical protein
MKIEYTMVDYHGAGPWPSSFEAKWGEAEGRTEPPGGEKKVKSKRVAEASRRVRKKSLRVNAEFAAIEEDPDA